MFRRLSTEIATLCAITSTALVLAAALLIRVAAIPATSAAALAGLLAYAIVRTLVAHRVARTVSELGGALSRAAQGEVVEVRTATTNTPDSTEITIDPFAPKRMKSCAGLCSP